MTTTYTQTPNNFSEIDALVETEICNIKCIFYSSPKVVFYDACSFQRHSHLGDREKSILIHYFKEQSAAIFITRCILMELASDYHHLEENYIELIRQFHDAGVLVVVFNEEYTYYILSECFATNQRINEYLMWAVRMAKSPVGTIEETLRAEDKLAAWVIRGENLGQADRYDSFFSAVRRNKEHEDNLGEELITVCVHMLSNLSGMSDGKLCVLTDDKGAAGKIDSVMRRTNPKNQGAKILLLSTPKLVQYIFRQENEISKEEMAHIIAQGTSGNITVMGITAYDLKVNEKISMTSKELAGKIMEPNGIDIIF